MCSRVLTAARQPAGDLDERLVREHEAGRPVHRLGGLLTPHHELARHGPLLRLEPAETGKALVDPVRIP